MLKNQIAVVESLSGVWLFATPWTAARKVPLSISIFLSVLKLEREDWVTAFHSSTSPCPTVTPLTHRMGAPGSALLALGLERRPGQARGKRMTLTCSSLQLTPEEAQPVDCTPFGRPCPKQSLIKRNGMPNQTNPKMHSSFTYTGFSLS